MWALWKSSDKAPYSKTQGTLLKKTQRSAKEGSSSRVRRPAFSRVRSKFSRHESLVFEIETKSRGFNNTGEWNHSCIHFFWKLRSTHRFFSGWKRLKSWLRQEAWLEAIL